MRPAIANLRIAELVGGVRKHGHRRGQPRVGGDRRVRGERAEREAVTGDLDPGQLGDPADVDELRRGREAQLHHRDQAVAAGKQLHVLAAVAQQRDRFVEASRTDVIERGRDHRAPPFCIAAQSFSGRSGMSMWVMPNGARASTTALAIAGVEPIVPASPTPLIPSGFTSVGVTV